ncbi:MAG: hypothetical protein NVS4B5_01560 [Vulcanimicrobiaceae bacterium]
MVKIALAVCSVGFLTLLASTLGRGNPKNAIMVLSVGLLPVFFYVATRWPIVFPFGLYALLVPFDPLLAFISGGGTLTKIVGIASIAALALRALLTRRVLVPPRSWLGWGAFVLLMIISLTWTISVKHTLDPLQIVISLFVLFTALAVYPISLAEFDVLRKVTIFAGVSIAAYGLYAFRPTRAPASMPGHLHYERLTLSSGRIHMDPNHFAAFFLIPIAFVLIAFLNARSWTARFAYGGMFALMAAEVSRTGSRGGFVGVAIVMLYLGIRSRRYLASAAITVGGLLVSLAFPTVWQRFGDKTQGANSGRNFIWSTGIRAFHDYWLTGSGFGTYPEAYDKYLLLSSQPQFQGWNRPAHNLFISIGVELGVFGLLVLVAVLFYTFRQNSNIPRTHALYSYRLAIEAMLVGLLWMSISIDVLWYKYVWLALAFNVLLANIYRPHEFRSSGSDLTQAPVERSPSRERAHARF